MHIEELKERELKSGEEELVADFHCKVIVVSDAKRALVGAGARVLFYPTLLYNVVRNKINSDFRWWDEVDEFILLGAVPFPTDVPRLKQLGVRGVITLNEAYETLVPTSLYHAHGIDHLVIPTRDYLFAPSMGDICQAVDFIHENASRCKRTYVHCKAGRGRSTTIVLCYLVQYKQMMPEAAYAYVRSIRSRVLLATAQWQAVQEFYHLRIKNTKTLCHLDNLVVESPGLSTTQGTIACDDNSVVVVTELDQSPLDKLVVKASGSSPTQDVSAFNDSSVILESEHSNLDKLVVKNPGSPTTQDIVVFNDSSVVLVTDSDPSHLENLVETLNFPATRDIADFDDSSVVVVTESDFDGYDGNCDSGTANKKIGADISLVYRFQFASQAALQRLSGLWLRCHTLQKMPGEKLGGENGRSVEADQLGGHSVDIHVY